MHTHTPYHVKGLGLGFRVYKPSTKHVLDQKTVPKKQIKIEKQIRTNKNIYRQIYDE